MSIARSKISFSRFGPDASGISSLSVSAIKSAMLGISRRRIEFGQFLPQCFGFPLSVGQLVAGGEILYRIKDERMANREVLAFEAQGFFLEANGIGNSAGGMVGLGQ